MWDNQVENEVDTAALEIACDQPFMSSSRLEVLEQMVLSQPSVRPCFRRLGSKLLQRITTQTSNAQRMLGNYSPLTPMISRCTRLSTVRLTVFELGRYRFRSRVCSPDRLTALSLSSGHHESPHLHRGLCALSQMESLSNHCLSNSPPIGTSYPLPQLLLHPG